MKSSKKKAEACDRFGFDSETNFTSGETSMLTTKEYNNQLESVQSTIERMMMSTPRVVRLCRCFSCKRNFPMSRMSGCLAICRDCLRRSRELGQQARHNLVDRIINDLRKYIRGGLEVR